MPSQEGARAGNGSELFEPSQRELTGLGSLRRWASITVVGMGEFIERSTRIFKSVP
jgi:hypothetical protein